MQDIRFISEAVALALHQDQINRYGGDAGLRDRGLLESALAMAGAYLFHLAKNHAFVDGNKRIALAAMLYFLDDHGYALGLTHEQAEHFVLGVAAGEMTKDQATLFLREHVSQR